MSDAENMTRKEILQPNKAEKLLYTFVDHAYRKRRLYIIFGIFLVSIILTVWGIRQYLAHERIEQANLFHNARTKFGDLTITEAERMSQGILALQKFTKFQFDSKLSVLALLESGRIFAQQSNYEESISEFKKVIEHPESTDFLRNVSRLSLAGLYEQKKEWDEAQIMLDSIDIDSWDDLRWRALARIAISVGDLERAKRLLEKLLEEFPDSVFRNETEALLLTL